VAHGLAIFKFHVGLIEWPAVRNAALASRRLHFAVFPATVCSPAETGTVWPSVVSAGCMESEAP